MTLVERLVASFGGIALFLLAGNGLLRFFPALRERPLFRRIATMWLLGVGGVGLLLFALDHVAGVPLRRWGILSVFFVLAALTLIPRSGKRKNGTSAAVRPPAARMAVTTAVVLGVCLTVGLFSEVIAEFPSDWDGLMTWCPAARWIRAEGTVNSRVLAEGQWHVSHPKYPPLLPLTQVAVQETFGTTDDARVPRPLYAMFLPAFALVLFDAASRRAGALSAALATISAALVPLFASGRMAGGAGSAFSDLPLACFWGTGFLLLLETGVVPSTGVAAGLLLSAGLLSKNEGLPLVLIVIAVAAFFAVLRSRRTKSVLRALLPVGLAALVAAGAAALLISWRSGIVNRNDEKYDERILEETVLRDTLQRLPLLPKPIWREMEDATSWAGFWWCAPVVLLAGAGALRRRPARPLLLGIAGGIAVYIGAYGISPWPGTTIVTSTWNRFLIQLSLPFFVLLAMSLRSSVRGVQSLLARTAAAEKAGGPAFRLTPVTRETLVAGAFLALAALMTWPWILQIRDHPAEVLATIFSLAFSGYGAFRLARTLTDSTGAAWVAGIGFAFVPTRFQYLSPAASLATGWMAMTLEAVVLYVRKPDWKRAAWTAFAYLMNALTAVSWFVLTLIPLAASFLFLLGRHVAQSERARVVLRATAAIGAASLLIFLLSEPYRRAAVIAGTHGERSETFEGSAQLHHWRTVDPRNLLWSPLGETPPPAERALFPGVVMPILAVAGFVLLRRGNALPDPAKLSDALGVGLIWVIVGVAGSFGLRFWFHRILYKLIPLYRVISVPAQSAILADLGLALLAAVGAFAFAEARRRRTGGRAVGAAVFTAICLLLLFEMRVAPPELLTGATERETVSESTK